MTAREMARVENIRPRRCPSHTTASSPTATATAVFSAAAGDICGARPARNSAVAYRPAAAAARDPSSSRSTSRAEAATRAANLAERLAHQAERAATDEQPARLDVDGPDRDANQDRGQHVPGRRGADRFLGDPRGEKGDAPELRQRKRAPRATTA